MSTTSNTGTIDEWRKKILEQEQKLRARIGKIKHKKAVISGKGGVGKSTITVNLAVAFAKHLSPFRLLLRCPDIFHRRHAKYLPVHKEHPLLRPLFLSHCLTASAPRWNWNSFQVCSSQKERAPTPHDL